MSGTEHAKTSSAEGSKFDEAAPQRMVQELNALQNLTNELIHTISKSSVPLGYRQSSGAQIHSFVRQILESNLRVKTIERDVCNHQERQRKVRQQIQTVQAAENRIDELVRDLQDIEADLSLMVHRAKQVSSTVSGGGAQSRSNELDVEDVARCAVGFDTGFGSPMHPPDQRDPRYLFPYPAAHSMRLQGEGGMWDNRSTRKPQLPAGTPVSEQANVDAKPDENVQTSMDEVALAHDTDSNKRARSDSSAMPNGQKTTVSDAAPNLIVMKDSYALKSNGFGLGEELDEMQNADGLGNGEEEEQEEEEEEEEDEDEFAMDLNPSYPPPSRHEEVEEEEDQQQEQQQEGDADAEFEDNDEEPAAGGRQSEDFADAGGDRDAAEAQGGAAAAGVAQESAAGADMEAKDGLSSDEGFSSDDED